MNGTLIFLRHHSGYAYDSDGRVTTDGAGGVTRSYGILGNPYQTKTGSTVNAQYTYTSDGTRVKAVNGSGTGYVYRGSFVYSTTGSSEVLESVGFGGGRIEKNGTGYEVAYHITDHLGSVRSIIKNGTIVEQNDYYPYGGRHANSALTVQTSPVPNRWRFSGKEDLSAALGDPVLDFGARMYSSTGAMWQTQDPLAEKYYGVSQYVYCANSPINYVDYHGDTLLVKDRASIEAIYNGILQESNKKLLFNNGVLDPNSINSNSGDFFLNDLRSIALSKTTVELSTASRYDAYSYSSQRVTSVPFGQTPYDYNDWDNPEEYIIALKSLGQQVGFHIQGNLGRAIFPESTGDLVSTNGNIQIYINSAGNINHRTVGISHEFGHVILYLQGKPYQHPEADDEIYNMRSTPMSQRLGYDF